MSTQDSVAVVLGKCKHQEDNMLTVKRVTKWHSAGIAFTILTIVV